MRVRGLSRTDVARMCEVAPYTVSRWLDPDCIGKRMYGLAAIRLERIGVRVVDLPDGTAPATYAGSEAESTATGEIRDTDDPWQGLSTQERILCLIYRRLPEAERLRIEEEIRMAEARCRSRAPGRD